MAVKDWLHRDSLVKEENILRITRVTVLTLRRVTYYKKVEEKME